MAEVVAFAVRMDSSCSSLSNQQNVSPVPPSEGVVMREKRSSMSKVQKIRRRISASFGKLSISRSTDAVDAREEEASPSHLANSRIPNNGFSEECLDRLEPNGNIPKEFGWSRLDGDQPPIRQQLAASSDSQLLDTQLMDEQVKVVLRPKKPPRPKSEVILCSNASKSKRLSAFGGDSPFGRQEAYIKLDQLGEGSYATVYKGYSNLTHQTVALKEIRLQEEEGAPFTAIREASLLKELKHANIVILHDIIHTKSSLTFVFEYVHTDLSQYLEAHPGGLHARNVQLLLYQLLRGLSYCHQRRILHRDVKPQNLLISQIGELKLADFGLARAKSVPSHTYSNEVVTLWYRPPDVLLGCTDYTTSLDLWGVGCIFVEMLAGVPCFPGVRDVADQLDKIFKVTGTPDVSTWPVLAQLPYYKSHRLPKHPPEPLCDAFPRFRDLSPHAESLAYKLLHVIPERRLSAEAALRHRYFGSLSVHLGALADTTSIFTVTGVRLHPEPQSLSPNMLKMAAQLKKKH